MAILCRPPPSYRCHLYTETHFTSPTSTFDPITSSAFLSLVAEEEAASSTSNHYFADLPPANLLTVGENDTNTQGLPAPPPANPYAQALRPPSPRLEGGAATDSQSSQAVLQSDELFPWLRNSSRIPTLEFDPRPHTPTIDGVSVERADESRIRDLLDIKHLTTGTAKILLCPQIYTQGAQMQLCHWVSE